MRTLHFIKDQKKRKRISRETHEIYAPLAGRIGMQELKEELEDLSFTFFEPKIRNILKERLRVSKKEKSKNSSIHKKRIRENAKENKIKCSVFGREKKPYSIWKKLEIQHKSLEQLSDIFGFRVCVETIQECYEVLGILHCEWQAIPVNLKIIFQHLKKMAINLFIQP